MNLNDFIEFNPLVDSGSKIPEAPGNYIVTIRDNGRGFDPEALAEDGERSHIGIRNVRERIESMCQGTMRIESEPWKGTTVTMTIPGGREEA